MIEPRADAFPDASSIPILDDNAGKETQPPAPPKFEEPSAPKAPEAPGEKTPQPNLYAALKEERQKRQELEARLKTLESSSPSGTDEMLSEEGKLLKKEIVNLQKRIEDLTQGQTLEQIISKDSVLQDKRAEFEEFLLAPENKGLSSSRAATVFKAENNLLETIPERKGLERPTGGPKTVPESGTISPEEVDRLRTEQPRLYIKMLRDGRLDPDKIR